MRRFPLTQLAVCAVAVLAAFAASGCMHPPGGGPQILEPSMDDYETPLPPGALGLRQLDPKDYPDFTAAAKDMLADKEGLRQAIMFSLDYLGKKSARNHFPYRVIPTAGSAGFVTHDQAVATLNMFLRMLDSNLDAVQINDAIHTQCDVYTSVGWNGRGGVLFTGYYTPILEGSRTRTERFRYPLYKLPPGMEKNDDGSPKTPMPDRATIENNNMFAGNELVWLSDPFEVYVAHVQGSAKVRLPGNPNPITVGYAGNNGHEYHSIRADLVKDSKIGKRDGLAAMLAYFKANPQDIATYVNRNPRFIFFAEVPDGRPRGCLNVPVTVRRTLATDKSVFPRACMAFMSARMPAGAADVQYDAFALDQDAGGAIRAAGRADIYVGVGDKAGELAGRTMTEGRLYYIFVKPAPATTGGALAPVSGN